MPENSLETILILAPPKSPESVEPKTFSIPIYSTISVLNKAKSIFLFSGSLDGIDNPFNVVVLYLSNNPLTENVELPCCFTVLVAFVTALAMSPTPCLLSCTAPIFSTISTLFL